MSYPNENTSFYLIFSIPFSTNKINRNFKIVLPVTFKSTYAAILVDKGIGYRSVNSRTIIIENQNNDIVVRIVLQGNVIQFGLDNRPWEGVQYLIGFYTNMTPSVDIQSVAGACFNASNLRTAGPISPFTNSMFQRTVNADRLFFNAGYNGNRIELNLGPNSLINSMDGTFTNSSIQELEVQLIQVINNNNNFYNNINYLRNFLNNARFETTFVDRIVQALYNQVTLGNLQPNFIIGLENLELNDTDGLRAFQQLLNTAFNVTNAITPSNSTNSPIPTIGLLPSALIRTVVNGTNPLTLETPTINSTEPIIAVATIEVRNQNNVILQRRQQTLILGGGGIYPNRGEIELGTFPITEITLIETYTYLIDIRIYDTGFLISIGDPVNKSSSAPFIYEIDISNLDSNVSIAGLCYGATNIKNIIGKFTGSDATRFLST